MPRRDNGYYGLTDESFHLLDAPVPYEDDARFQELKRKEGYYRGTAYDSRPNTWAGGIITPYGEVKGLENSKFIPFNERKPSAAYHLGRPIVNRFVAMLVGERRFPRIRVPGDPTTEECIQLTTSNMQLKAHFTEAATIGGSEGSVCVVLKVVDGEFRLEVFDPKWITPVWDDFHAGKLDALRILYPYSTQVYDKDKKSYLTKWFVYRRIITKTHDVTFVPQELKDADGLRLKNPEETPTPDENKIFCHDFGFCPAVYIQNLPRYDQTDGDSTYEAAFDLIDRICEQLSAVDHALKGNLDPTLLLKITPEDWKKLESMGGVVQTGADGACLIVGDKGDGKYLELNGDGIRLAMDIIDKLKNYALETCDCVMADPERISGNAQSAAAIVKLYAHMLSKTDMLRTQYGERGIKPIVGMMLEIIRKKSKVSYRDEDGKIVRGKFKLPKKIDPETGKKAELKPSPGVTVDDIYLQWGEYFEPTTDDVFKAVEAATMALGGSVPASTVEIIVKYLAPFLHDNDPINTAKLVQALHDELKEMKEKEAEAKKGQIAGGENKQASSKRKGAGSSTKAGAAGAGRKKKEGADQ